MRTAELIEEADVIVYDVLLSADILSRIPRETETIYVGKHAGNHPVPQEEINQILVREAKKGKRVLRLKGGDPFVFGRGGEEIEILRNEKISFEIIPGITSSVAVPAYAGIPVTPRDYTSSFHVITCLLYTSDIISKVGGFDIAGLTGVFLGGAIFRIPIVIDGFISSVAALCAARLVPDCIGYMLPSHCSGEPAASKVLDELGLSALLDCGMSLGEGSGAVAVMPLLEMGLSVYKSMSTFEEIRVEQYEELKLSLIHI